MLMMKFMMSVNVMTSISNTNVTNRNDTTSIITSDHQPSIMNKKRQ